jgi:hypothetical protein
MASSEIQYLPERLLQLLATPEEGLPDSKGGNLLGDFKDVSREQRQLWLPIHSRIAGTERDTSLQKHRPKVS